MSIDREAIVAWINADPDENTRAEALALLEASDTPDAANILESRFSTEITLNTDGIYAPVEAGSSRINAAMVSKNVAGLCHYLNGTLAVAKDLTPPLILIGYDERPSSLPLAQVAAKIAAGSGARVQLFPNPIPTPLLAHAVKQLPAEAAIMISGSSFPQNYNGLKVFLSGRVSPSIHSGSLIAASTAAAVSDWARALPAANLLPISDDIDTPEAPLLEAYLDSIKKLIADYPKALTASQRQNSRAQLRIAISGEYTSTQVLEAALQNCGFVKIEKIGEESICAEKETTSVRDPKCLASLESAAQTAGADVFFHLAADGARLVVGVPCPNCSGEWRILDSDEVALLALPWLAEKVQASPHLNGKTPALVSTAVCSTLPRMLAAEIGMRSFIYPRGFGLMCRQGGAYFVYQQRDGFCFDPQHVRDSDGISAAVVIASIFAYLRSEKKTLISFFSDYYLRHGLYTTTTEDFHFSSISKTERYTRYLRSGKGIPGEFAGSRILGWCDLGRPCPHGSNCPARAAVGQLATPLDAIVGVGGGGERVIVRAHPSRQTVSLYVQISAPLDNPDNADALRRTNQRRAQEIIASLHPDLVLGGTSQPRL